MKIFPMMFSASLLAFTPVAYAEGDISRANPIEIAIEMGQVDATHMYFRPDHLDLQTGQAYKIVFTNTDSVKHEFAAPELMGKLFMRKVEVLGADDKMIAEIKGTITEIEVAPGGVVEWFIVPIQTGTDIPILCEIEGHEEAGMIGTVTIN